MSYKNDVEIVTKEKDKKWDTFEVTLRIFLRETQNMIITFKNGYSFTPRRIPRDKLFKQDEEVYEVVYYNPDGEELTRIVDCLILANDNMASFTDSVTVKDLKDPNCVPKILYLRILGNINDIEQEKIISKNIQKVLKNNEYVKSYKHLKNERRS